jgi:hypothetical protein
MLTKSSIIFALAFSSAYAGEVEYKMPRIPSETEKVEALKLGFILNGGSMVGDGRGSIDVSASFNSIDAEANTLRPADPWAPRQKKR